MVKFNPLISTIRIANSHSCCLLNLEFAEYILVSFSPLGKPFLRTGKIQGPFCVSYTSEF